MEVKNKGERETYMQLNTGFQKRAGRDKKAFFNEQWQQQKGKRSRDLFRKTSNIKGAFCPKMGTIKYKNDKDPVDAEEIKKRWKEYMEELKKKDLNELDYYDGTVSHSELDILECKVKWASRSSAINKASGCNEISAELFKSLKDDAIKVLHSSCQQIWKTWQWSQVWKRSILIPVPKKGITKECANHWTITLMSHVSKVTLKILHARLQCYAH